MLVISTESYCNERWNNKFYYRVASCWLFLLNHVSNAFIFLERRLQSYQIYSGDKNSNTGVGIILSKEWVKRVKNYLLYNDRIITWSLTLREERRLRVFENRVLRRVFGPKRAEVTGEWRKLHNEELNDLYSLPNIVRVVKSRRMRWAEHVARMGEDRGVHRILVGKPEGKRPLRRPRRR